MVGDSEVLLVTVFALDVSCELRVESESVLCLLVVLKYRLVSSTTHTKIC